MVYAVYLLYQSLTRSQANVFPLFPSKSSRGRTLESLVEDLARDLGDALDDSAPPSPRISATPTSLPNIKNKVRCVVNDGLA